MIEIMLSSIRELFAGLTERCLELSSGNYLFHRGDRVSSLYFVVEGTLALTRYQEDGQAVVLQRATSNQVLAEASLYAGYYHCDGVAETSAIVLGWSKKQFIAQLNSDPRLSNLWANHLASELVSARAHCEILSRKTVADRLDGWLGWQGSMLPPRGEWKALALQLSVSPEALYRELSRRRIK